jgi:transcriptional regulator with XRE-family HTH domain
VSKIYYRDDKYLKKFGVNLAKIRKGKSVSQEELANDLGFSQPYLAKVEGGLVNLSISHIVAIAKKLKISVSSLVELD